MEKQFKREYNMLVTNTYYKEYWLEAKKESERDILPYNYIMQNIYNELYKDERIQNIVKKINKNCIDYLYEFNELSNIETERLKFICSYVIDTMFFDYSLISIYSNEQVRRDTINVKSKNVSVSPYMPNGISWEDEDYSKYHLFIESNKRFFYNLMENNIDISYFDNILNNHMIVDEFINIVKNTIIPKYK